MSDNRLESLDFNRMKRAEELLREKYHEDFVVYQYIGQGMLDNFYTINAYSLSHPEMPFNAYVSIGGSSVSDEYFTKILCEKMAHKIMENMAGISGDFYIHIQPMLMSSVESDIQISVKDYLKNNPFNFYTIYMYIDLKEKMTDLYAKIGDSISKIGMIDGNLILYQMSDEKILEVQEYVDTHTRIYSEHDETTEAYMLGIFEFEKGKFKNTEFERRAGESS